MATFLFWNMMKKPLSEALFRLVTAHDVDVLVLAECALSPQAVLTALNRGTSVYEFPQTNLPEKDIVRIFVKSRLPTSPNSVLQHRWDHTGFRWTIRQFFPVKGPDILLVAVHLPSKRTWGEAGQASLCGQLSRDIQRVENEVVRHRRTVVAGDFNMNPFESGMIGAFELNAESTRAKAQAGTRKIYDHNYPFFYNPMWSLFGDAVPGPSGTHHYAAPDPVRMTWNMFDQVLLRPDLLPFFNLQELEILSGDGVESFLTSAGVPKGRPNRRGQPENPWSDHLPLLWKLNFPR